MSWRVDGICEAEGLTDAGGLSPLTLEHIGVLAIMLDDVTNHVEQLQAFERRLRRAISAFDAVGRTQQEYSSEAATSEVARRRSVTAGPGFVAAF